MTKLTKFHEHSSELTHEIKQSHGETNLDSFLEPNLEAELEISLKTLKTSRKLWQIAASTIPEPDFTNKPPNNSTGQSSINLQNYYLSLNSYLTAWIYTVKSLSAGSSAMKQMVDPLNGILCELSNFGMNTKYFDSLTSNAKIVNDEYILEMFREMGTTYRMLDMIGKLQSALSNPDKKSLSPEELTYRAYLESELSKRHGWMMKNSVKMALKIGLPKIQTEFTLDLAGVDVRVRNLVSQKNLGIEHVLSKVQQEYSQIVKSMAEVKEYLGPALSGDTDEMITNRVPDIYETTVFLKNNRNGLLGVCKLRFSDRNRKVSFLQSFSENSQVEEIISLGKECEITICK